MIAGSLQIEMAANLARLSKDMGEAKNIVGGAMRNIDSAVARTKGLLASLGVGIGFQQIIALTDQYTKFTAQLKLATTSQSEYGKALSDVRSIAQAAQADLGGVGVLYARIANGTRELGLNQQRVSDITEVVSLALKASGATAAESASAMLQLSQAFGSGVLRGQEFNAVNEAAPRLMKALADGIGVPVGQLRAMAEAGKLTSEVMANALPRALQELRKEAAQVQTIAGAFTVLKNNVMEFIGTQAQANGSVKVITTAIGLLSENLSTLTAIIGGLTVIKLSQWIIGVAAALQTKTTAVIASIAAVNSERTAILAATAAEIANAQSTLAFIAADRARAVSQMQSAQATIAATAAMGAQSGALAANTAATAANAAAIASLANLGRLQATATAGLATAQAAHTAALASGGVAATGLARLLGFLGGPIGVITTALGLGASAWLLWGNNAEAGEKKAAESLKTSEVLANLDKQIEKLKERNALAGKVTGTILKGDSPNEVHAREIMSQMERARKGEGEFAALNEQARGHIVGALAQEYGRVATKIAQVNKLTEEFNAIGQRTKAAKWMDDYATKAEKLAAELKKAKEELGPAFTPELERRIREKFAEKGDDTARKKAEELVRLYNEVVALGRSIDVSVIFPKGGDVDKNKRDLEALKKTLTEAQKDWVAYAQSVFDASDAEQTAAAQGPSFTEHAEKLREKLLDLIDPLRAIKREHQEIDLLVSTGWMTEADARLAKLPQSVRDLLQPMKNIHEEIQKAWESGLLTTEQMQDAVLRATDKIEKATEASKDFGHAISTAFEDAVIEGRKLSDVVKALGVTIAKIFFRQNVTTPLEGALGKINFGGLFSSFLGGGSSVNAAGFGGGQMAATAAETMAFWGHTGGIVGQLTDKRPANAAHFYGAPRYHGGGIVNGEVPVVAKAKEGIFTEEQMRALAPASELGGVTYAPTINVDSRTDRAEIIAIIRREDARTVEKIADLTRRGGGFKKAIRG